ncbi:MAG: response regulator transcription factor [Panacagrimonas sp.]
MSHSIVYVVDDEDAVRDSLQLLLQSAGFDTAGCASAYEFLATYDPSQSGCLVLDVRMPRMSGLELQQTLNRKGWMLPVIFISGHGDVPMAVEAMREGAFDFIQKPFSDAALLKRVRLALKQDDQQRQEWKSKEALSTRWAQLTNREKQVAGHLCKGDANKVIAIDLGISERTVELHRAHIMRKMQARGIAQLVRMMLSIGQSSEPSTDTDKQAS